MKNNYLKWAKRISLNLLVSCTVGIVHLTAQNLDTHTPKLVKEVRNHVVNGLVIKNDGPTAVDIAVVVDDLDEYRIQLDHNTSLILYGPNQEAPKLYQFTSPDSSGSVNSKSGHISIQRIDGKISCNLVSLDDGFPVASEHSIYAYEIRVPNYKGIKVKIDLLQSK